MTKRDKMNDALTAAAKRRGVLGVRTGTVSMESHRNQHKKVVQNIPGASKYRPLWTLGMDEVDPDS